MTRHLNLDEQADLGSLTTQIIADEAITASKLSTVENFNFTLDVTVGGTLIVLGGVNPDPRTGLQLPFGSLRPEYISTYTTDNYTFPNAIIATTFTIQANGATPPGPNSIGGATTMIGDGLTPTLTITNGNIDLAFNEALNFRLENVLADPVVTGHPGRLFWNVTEQTIKVDTGTAFVPLAAVAGAVTGVGSDSNPYLTGNIQFVSGTGITLSQLGQAITINSTATSTPGGSNRQIQFNNSGAFGASAHLFYTEIGGNNLLTIDSTGTDQARIHLKSDQEMDIAWYDASNTFLGGIELDGPNQGVNAGRLLIETVGATGQIILLANGKNWIFDSAGTLTTPGDVDVSGFNVVNLADPLNPQDAATKAYVDSFVSSLTPANFVLRETPAGVVDGVNTVFTLAFTPVIGKEAVYLNGLQQDPGATNDYTISGPTITFTDAPVAPDKIRVSYIK